MAFATIDELEKTLRTTVDDIDAASQALDYASSLIQAYVGQQLESVSGDTYTCTEPRDGIIVLPERPVTAITSVVLGDVTLTETDDYEWDSDGTIFHVSTSLAWQVPAFNTNSYARLSAGSPLRKVTVTYDHGYDPIPNDVRMVCCQIAAHGWGTGPGGIAQESIGNYSVSYHGPGEEVGGPATVVVLGKYRGMTVR